MPGPLLRPVGWHGTARPESVGPAAARCKPWTRSPPRRGRALEGWKHSHPWGAPHCRAGTPGSAATCGGIGLDRSGFLGSKRADLGDADPELRPAPFSAHPDGSGVKRPGCLPSARTAPSPPGRARRRWRPLPVTTLASCSPLPSLCGPRASLARLAGRAWALGQARRPAGHGPGGPRAVPARHPPGRAWHGPVPCRAGPARWPSIVAAL